MTIEGESAEGAEDQVVPENQESQETETTESKTEAESSPDKPKVSAQTSDEDGARKRINKLVWQREEAKREADYWRSQAQRQAQQTTPPEQPKPSNDGRPNVNDPRWKTYEEYTEALAEWTADRKIEARLKVEQERSVQTSKQRRMAEAMETFNERAEKVREKYPDYDELFDSALISEAMAEPILGSDSGPEIAVYLAKNPDVAKRLYRLDPTSAAREIGKIEAKLDDLLQENTVSNAPPPMKPIRPKGEVSNQLSDKMDIQTWMKVRGKQVGKK
jgi:hypothetical protein